MKKVTRCDGAGRIIGLAAGFDDMFEKHEDSVLKMKFNGTIDREDVGSPGESDYEGGTRSCWSVSISGMLSGIVYLPHDMVYDANNFKGASGPASFLKRTLEEDRLPDAIEGAWQKVFEITSRNVTVKSMRIIKPDFYDATVEISLTGFEGVQE